MTINLPEARPRHKANLKRFCACLVKNVYSMWMEVEKVGFIKPYDTQHSVPIHKCSIYDAAEQVPRPYFDPKKPKAGFSGSPVAH
jgi:hypothetical protein